MKNQLFLCMGLFCASTVFADSVPSWEMPPIRFAATLEDEAIFNALQATPAFAKLNKEIIGSPLLLRVSHTHRGTTGGSAAGFTSGLLAGGSLGILPVVTNRDLVITYEILVQGAVIARFDFLGNFTEAINIYSDKGMGRVSEKELEWIRSTIKPFIEQASQHAEVKTLLDEYHYYFSE